MPFDDFATLESTALTIALVNLMPPPAQSRTHAMFSALVTATRQPIRLLTFETASALRQSGPVDALIVTGTQPCAAHMQAEPAYPHLQQLVDWAAENTITTIWSCFSAHAAVHHLHGIRRQRFPEKLHGVFLSRKTGNHCLLAGLPAYFPVPQSRHHGLAAEDLLSAGYELLSHSPRAGADSFTLRHGASQFLFLQGHPEYAADTLCAEFCRDAKAYFTGALPRYPSLPENYFDDEIASEFAALAASAPSGLLFSAAAARAKSRLTPYWQEAAQQLFGNWLQSAAIQKRRQGRGQHAA